MGLSRESRKIRSCTADRRRGNESIGRVPAKGSRYGRDGDAGIVTEAMRETNLPAEFERVFVLRPAHRIRERHKICKVVVIRGCASSQNLVGLKIHTARSQTDHDRVSAVVRKERLIRLACIWIRQAIRSVSSHA